MPQAASYDRAGAVPSACGAPLSATVSVIISDGRAGVTCSAVCAASDAPATSLCPAEA
jgi:hypothetical protein